MERQPIVLTVEAAEELYRLLFANYLSPNAYPHLTRLLDEIARAKAVQA